MIKDLIKALGVVVVMGALITGATLTMISIISNLMGEHDVGIIDE